MSEVNIVFCKNNILKIEKILHLNEFYNTHIEGDVIPYILMINGIIEGFALILKKELKLCSFCINPKYHNQNIGFMFYIFIERKLKNKYINQNFEIILESKFDKIKFYQKCGFKITGSVINCFNYLNEEIEIYSMSKYIKYLE